MKSLGELRKRIDEELKPLEAYSECIFLDYPAHYNAGDHFIFLGTLEYLRQKGITIRYLADLAQYDQKIVDAFPTSIPILFHGGGNLGDLWPDHEMFREQVIAQNHNRPIYVLPQALYFKDQEKFHTAAAIYNDHPNLTLYVRDTVSENSAKQEFSRCAVRLCPDMACMLDLEQYKDIFPRPKDKTLYILRKDKELAQPYYPYGKIIDRVEDWRTLRFGKFYPFFSTLSKIRSRRIWNARKSKYLAHDRSAGQHIDFSWNILHESMYQLAQYTNVVSTRLHGYILAVLMNRTATLLPNAYHKNKAYFETWMKDLPQSTFLARSGD